MLIYVLSLLLTLILMSLAIKNKDNKNYKILIILSVIPFLFISAFRYDVGTDYFYRYAPNYITIANGGDIKNLEFTFKILIKVCSFFTDSYVSLFFVTSAIIIIPIFYIIYKKSKYPLLSIILFIIGGFFFDSLNLVRQYISIVIILCSHSYLLDKKYFKWILCVLFATLFHKSALIGLLLFLIRDKKYFKPRYILPLSIIIILFGNYIRDIMVFLISLTPYSNYVDSIYAKSDIRETMIIANSIIYLTMLILYGYKEKNKKTDKFDIFYMNVQSLTMILCLFSIQFNLLYRMVEYFSIFQIISIPYMLDLKKKYGIYILIGIIILYGINFYHLFIKNNVNEITPYYFVFDKERKYD